MGYDSGFEKGEKKALEKGTQEQAKKTNHFKSILSAIHQYLINQRQEMSDNIPDIVLAISKAVVTQELSQGSEHIVSLVQQAVESLPLDSGNLRIDVNPLDLPFIEAAIEQGEFEGEAHASEKIDAGGCRIHTRYSAVNFTLSERWQTIEKQYRRQLQLSQDEDEDEDDEFNVMTMSEELEREQQRQDAIESESDQQELDEIETAESTGVGTNVDSSNESVETPEQIDSSNSTLASKDNTASEESQESENQETEASQDTVSDLTPDAKQAEDEEQASPSSEEKNDVNKDMGQPPHQEDDHES